MCPGWGCLACRLKFFKPQPKLGGYFAAAVPSAAPGAPLDTYHAILAADTLLPEGNGQAFSERDQAFIAGVAQVGRHTNVCGGGGHASDGRAAWLSSAGQAARAPNTTSGC